VNDLRVFVGSNDEIGTLASCFCQMSDQVADREAQLRESSRRLATGLQGMVEGDIAGDDRERIVLANAAAGRLLDFSPAEAQGKPLSDVARNQVIHEALARPQDDQPMRQLVVELSGDKNRVLSFNVTMLSAEASTFCIMMLRVMEGPEVCRHLRADPGTQGTFVVILTTKSEERDPVAGLAMGPMMM
jgi:signal transduction histidine kinase